MKDALAVAIGGTNVIWVPGTELQTNQWLSSGEIDVRRYVGQTNELFIGIVGNTSTNAELTVQNLTFEREAPPTIEAVAEGDQIVLTWPVTSIGYALESTTNMVNWEVVPDVPEIIKLRNRIAQQASGYMTLYRLRR
jgi:hypothetical protein